MLPITVPIFFQNEDTKADRIIGNGFPLSKCDTRQVTFYNVNCLFAHVDLDDLDNETNDRYTEIHINGDCYICALSVDEVRYMIEAPAFRIDLSAIPVSDRERFNIAMGELGG